MPDKQPPNTSVAVYRSTYNTVIEIAKLPHMLAKDGRTRSLIEVMSEVVEFYRKEHQKGQR
jgi:hypothetical protein